MVILLDQLAQRYGLLPSEAISKASTFDMVVMDMALTFEQYQMNKDKAGFVPDVPVETLQNILESTK